MFVAGVDGCRGGWILFRVARSDMTTTIETIDLPSILRERPDGLECVGIDIPIGLLDAPRACDRAAREHLGRPRGCSVFPTPCRAAVQSTTYAVACQENLARTGRRISQQAWGIAAKIKEVDEVLTPAHQAWAFEVHPEVCFWAMKGRSPMLHGKKSAAGVAERLHLLQEVFPRIRHHAANRPSGVAADDVLDAAAAAWSALRHASGKAEVVCTPERDIKGLVAAITF